MAQHGPTWPSVAHYDPVRPSMTQYGPALCTAWGSRFPSCLSLQQGREMMPRWPPVPVTGRPCPCQALGLSSLLGRLQGGSAGPDPGHCLAIRTLCCGGTTPARWCQALCGSGKHSSLFALGLRLLSTSRERHRCNNHRQRLCSHREPMLVSGTQPPLRVPQAWGTGTAVAAGPAGGGHGPCCSPGPADAPPVGTWPHGCGASSGPASLGTAALPAPG